MNEFNVNDGNGLFDDSGLIDSLIEDCNELPKDLIDGHNIRFCSRLVGMVQKLANLKTGVRNELEASHKRYDELRQAYDSITEGRDENGLDN